MRPDLEKFIHISKLDSREVAALKSILQNPSIMAMAENIARLKYQSIPQQELPDYEESPELCQAWFAAAYLSFDFSRQRFQQLNIPENLWLDTMNDLRVWLRNEERNSGIIGIGPAPRTWLAGVYQGRIIQHGRLQCSREFYYQFEPLKDQTGKTVLFTGDPVINLHIPEEGPMDLAACCQSLKSMAEFYAAYKPEYQWKGFLCESWLLDRQLRNMLPPTSNILKFQNLGQHFMMHVPSDTVFRLFGYADPAATQNPTTLQKNVIKFLQDGGQFMMEGMFIPRDVIEAAEYDFARLPPPEL